jgi:hypothetical protein
VPNVIVLSFLRAINRDAATTTAKSCARQLRGQEDVIASEAHWSAFIERVEFENFRHGRDACFGPR